ncbi:unnamed protein product [Ostreobium quekettii]|uniref:Uncharacterized protein n=1 Tax=Ostreobium quekettii TaxID=121088 RepID=A0A8S1JFA8_9CHLO|nr:unnamed protein product [Ostreobium quekettii]|eukprot:evm.model.scf_219.11 EVM.evm.TU.scf_219.11   scf_219:109353-111723(-)
MGRTLRLAASVPRGLAALRGAARDGLISSPPQIRRLAAKARRRRKWYAPKAQAGPVSDASTESAAERVGSEDAAGEGAEEGQPAPSSAAIGMDWESYKIPHRFVGFNPKRLDLENLPRIRKDVDGKPSRMMWHGTECQKCGLQVRREKRTNRQASLNIYADEKIPLDMLRSCPEEKKYPLLWRSRDPFLALDILGVDD